jgi:environmental stress-induced protein Ves
LFKTWSDALTTEAIAPCLDHLKSNHAYYKARIAAAATSTPAAASASASPSNAASAHAATPSITHIHAKSLVSTPWANGGGLTRQVAIHPPSASFPTGPFDYRLSSATIEASGPFSVFPGTKRLLTSVSGSAQLLVAGGDTMNLTPGRVLQFDGAATVNCELADPTKPVVDVGLIYSSSLTASGRLVAVAAEATSTVTLDATPQQHHLLVLINGAVSITTAGQTFEMEQMDCIHVTQALSADLRVELKSTARGGDATLMLFQIQTPTTAAAVTK